MTITRLRKLILTIVFLQFAFVFPVVLNIPLARQVIVFLCLIFMPGLMIVKALRLGGLHWVEIMCFTVGFSLAFLMIVGLFINETGPLIGFLRPLSELPLVLVLDGALVSMSVLGYITKIEFKFNVPGDLKLDRSIVPAIPFVLLPILSIVGAIWVNAYGDNRILLFLIIAIAGLFVLGVLSGKMLPEKLYPIALASTAIALLFHFSLVSHYITGVDIQLEYYSFRSTQDAAIWNSVTRYWWDYTYNRFNSMIGITILPTIFSDLLNIDATWTLKIVYPLIFSLVPLCLYQIWQTFIGKKRALVTAFFFMAQLTFYTEMLALAREMIAELFFVLLLFVLLNNKMKPFNRKLCFMVFASGLVLSHYSMSIIFLVSISLVLISLFLMKQPSTIITPSMVVFFFGIMFSWYIFTSSSGAFTSFLTFGENVYGDLSGFLSISSRGTGVMRGLGLESAPTIWNTVSRIFAYATQFLIVVGFIILIIRRNKRTPTHVSFSREYMIFSSMNMVLLASLIVVPGLAETMRMERFYHILSFILAPFCVLGAEKLVALVTKSKKELKTLILLLIILIPYFLFQTNLIYEVVGSRSESVPLSGYRMDRFRLYFSYGYIDERSVFGAQWMSEHLSARAMSMDKPICADLMSTWGVLTSYGMLYRGKVDVLSKQTIVAGGEAVYLNPFNVIDGRFVDSSTYPTRIGNTSEISLVIGNLDKLYSNGASEVYQNSQTVP